MKNSYYKYLLFMSLLIISPSILYPNIDYSVSRNNQQNENNYLISNNVFNRIHVVGSDGFIFLELNEVNESYTYVSTEINFEIERDLLKVFEAENGIPYVLPTGSSVVGKGESPTNEGESVVPFRDIRGFYRKQQPDIGATDYFKAGEMSMQETKLNHVRVYHSNQNLIIESTDEIGKIEIYDITGKLILSETVFSNRFTNQFNLNGWYIVTVTRKHRIVKKILL